MFRPQLVPFWIFYFASYLSYLNISTSSSSLCRAPSTMDRLQELGIDYNAPTSEYLPVLSSFPVHTLLSLKDELFQSAASRGQTTERYILVSRRDTRRTSLSLKLAEDTIALTICLKNNMSVPRSLLKNGKRRKDYLQQSRQSQIELSSQFTPSSPNSSSQRPDSHLANSESSGVLNPPHLTEPTSTNNSVRFSSLMREVNLIRKDVDSIKRDGSSLDHNCQAQPTATLDTCHIKVYFPGCSSPVLNPAQVSFLLGCPILLLTQISTKSIKVKIRKISLFDCLQSADPASHLVCVWKNHGTCHSTPNSPPPSSSTV